MISGATVAVDPPAVGPAVVSGVTNNDGLVQLNTASLSNGNHTLRITPPHTSGDPVGPATASGGPPPPRIFRSLEASIRTLQGHVTTVNVAGPHQENGAASLGANPRVIVDLQPVWIRSPNHGNRGTDISMIVVHHTGGPAISPTLNQFLNATTSAHYVIDINGRIVKMVQDSQRASHAGTAHWNGSTSINSASIGIEIVNQSGAYPEAQYPALLDLIDRLLTAHPSIPARNIVGHSDVATDASGRLGRKSSDPGLQFEWLRLETRNWGLVPNAGPSPPSVYGGFFDLVPNGSFRRNDSDDTRRFGGAHRPAVAGNPIEELQQDLSNIGYSVGTIDGDFGAKTLWAVQMFQEHFFAGGRGSAPNGRVDFVTAQWIKQVV